MICSVTNNYSTVDYVRKHIFTASVNCVTIFFRLNYMLFHLHWLYAYIIGLALNNENAKLRLVIE